MTCDNWAVISTYWGGWVEMDDSLEHFLFPNPTLVHQAVPHLWACCWAQGVFHEQEPCHCPLCCRCVGSQSKAVVFLSSHIFTCLLRRMENFTSAVIFLMKSGRENEGLWPRLWWGWLMIPWALCKPCVSCEPVSFGICHPYLGSL